MTGGPSDKIPLTVLTGFLGAGKTTLLDRLLRRTEAARTAVIVNEVGEIGLDHELVASAEESVLLLEGGCLCCAVRGDLLRALDGLWRRRARGRADFDRVVIETSGLADPVPILQTLIVDPVAAARFRLDGVVTLVDAVHGAATLEVAPEAVRQVAMADRLVVSKTDLADPAQLAALEAKLRAHNPIAPIRRAVRGDLEPAALFDCGPWSADGRRPEVERWLGEAALAAAAEQSDGHGHDHAHDHDHRHGLAAGDGKPAAGTHGTGIATFCVRREEPLSAAAAGLLLSLLTACRGAELLRVKGILAIREDPERPLVVHAVQHLVHEPIELDAWPSGDRSSRLVFVTRNLPRQVVEELWDKVVTYEAAAASGEATDLG